MRALLAALALSLAAAAFALSAGAVEPDEMLKDPALEARARSISQKLRCLVCQNQSIDDSNAGLARDLRVLLRERLTEGDSDEAAVAFIVVRYGDFVLLRPPVKPTTYVLWFGPVVIFVLGLAGLVFYFRQRKAAPVATSSLSEAESRKLAALLDDGDGP